MSTPTRIFHLLDVLGIEQREFAEAIGTTNKVVSQWKTGRLRSYTKYLREIVGYFGISPDYFLGRGVFENWDLIMKYPISVFEEIRSMLPPGFIDFGLGKDTELIPWLDRRMCYGITGNDEIDLIRWFFANVSRVELQKKDNIPEIYSAAKVTIEFKDSMLKQINFLDQKPPDSSSNSAPASEQQLKAAFWGGDKDLSQEDLDAMWADVKNFAAFVAEKKKREKQQDG